jgi:hypothetical protein
MVSKNIGLPEYLIDNSWALCGRLSTVLHSILIKSEGRKSPNIKCRCNQTQVWIKHDDIGTLGIACDNCNTIPAKLEYTDNPAMFV